MATKENQALQISLIIFFVLMIISSVFAFMFFRWYEDALLSAKAATEEKKKSLEAQRSMELERDEIKATIGAEAADTVKTIKEAFDEDMKNYGASVKESDRRYRPLLKILHAEIIGADVKLVEAKQREEELKAKIAANEKAYAAELAQFRSKLDQAAADLTSERSSFTESREEIEKGKNDIAKQIDSKRKESDDLAKKAADEIAGLTSQIQRLGDRLKAVEEIRVTTTATRDLPRGKVTFVNQRDRIVWINVGPADGLARQVTFKVLPASEPNLVEAKSKGSIEVVRMLDSHLAEARIVDDKITDPILPGDQIFSQVWIAGQVKHFGLCGFMDIDGDHESDRRKIKNLIASSGGVVDAEVTDEGKRVGDLSINTSYIVVGERPSDKGATADFLKAYSEMLAEGTSLGIHRINLEDFLNNLGYIPEEHAVAMDGKAEPTEFKAKAGDGVVRKSSGQFTPRKPHPASSRPSAY